MRLVTLPFLMLFGLWAHFAMADPVDPEKARRVGEHFLLYHTLQKPAGFTLSLTLAETSHTQLPSNQQTIAAYYLFVNSGGGFVLVAGDDRVQPVLGYSLTYHAPVTGRPDHVEAWLEEYRWQIAEVVDQRIPPTPETAMLWQKLTQGQGPEPSAGSVSTVNPLISTLWDQSPYYNALAPFDQTYNQRTVAGCVATAMAMLMKYYNYPANGSGFHSYTHEKYGVQSANFGATTYGWAQMPNVVNSANNAVATLMYHCGVAVDMDYGVGATGGSGAYVINAKSPVQHCAEYAFETYFGYKPSLQGVERANYSQFQWINLLKSELDASRPVYYAGFGSGGGHAFLCDGYDANNFFHFNWGWSGSFNGYFSINALNPSGVGTGGGSGGYNSGHQAIVGIEPLEESDPDPGPQSHQLALYNYVYSSANPILYGDGFTITTNVVNLGTNNFAGDYGAAVFDEDLNFVDFVEVKTGWSLEAGYTYTNNIVFSTPGLLSMVPGTYYIGIFYRPNGGDWVLAADNGNYTNILTQYVVWSNTIEMYSEMITTPVPNFIQGQSASVNFNLLNNGVSTFQGQYQVNLFQLDGTFVTTLGTINENNGLPPGYVYLHPFLLVTTPQLNVQPGTYLLAVMFKDAFSSNWSLAGSSEYPNPIRVIVESPGIPPDGYEANNSAGTSHVFPVTFTNNTAKILTTGSNLHIESDLDFYRINLNTGYQYSVQARLHDSWDSGDGKTYSLDGLFSISTDGGQSWSEAHDDVMPGPINVGPGGHAIFQVAPFFVGETGTYLLDITIVRSPVTATEEPEALRGISLFPNPVRDRLTIHLGDYSGTVHRIEGGTADGTFIPLTGQRKGNVIDLQLPTGPGGLFPVRIVTDDGVITRKLIRL